MKHRRLAILVGTALTLAATFNSHGMSELISLSTAPLWPVSLTPDNNLAYSITTVGRGGAGLLEVTLTAAAMPAGVTVTFTPSVLRFTGNQATAHTATMTVHCTGLVPLDCYPFTVTGTSRRGSITTTNWVTYTPDYVRTRIPTLELDNLGNNELRLRGLGATGQSYNIEATSDLGHPVWESLGTTTADGNGRFVFFTTQTATAPLRFYRAVLPAP